MTTRVVKTKRARLQHDWYAACDVLHPAHTYDHETDSLSLDIVKGVPVCTSMSRLAVEQIFKQVKAWAKRPCASRSWADYVKSVSARASLDAIKLMRDVDVPMGTFCHGDLTLENVLLDGHSRLWYIDPNPSAFCSHWLDVGKLAFSLEYHDRFSSYWLTEAVREQLTQELQAYDPRWVRACLVSHVVRLRGYRPDNKVDSWLRELCR